MKFAVREQLVSTAEMAATRRIQKLTICRRIHHNETSINYRAVLSPSPWHCICVPAEAIGSLVDVDIVGCTVESPESCYACTAAAHDGHLLPRDRVRPTHGS